MSTNLSKQKGTDSQSQALEEQSSLLEQRGDANPQPGNVLDLSSNASMANQDQRWCDWIMGNLVPEVQQIDEEEKDTRRTLPFKGVKAQVTYKVTDEDLKGRLADIFEEENKDLFEQQDEQCAMGHLQRYFEAGQQVFKNISQTNDQRREQLKGVNLSLLDIISSKQLSVFGPFGHYREGNHGHRSHIEVKNAEWKAYNYQSVMDFYKLDLSNVENWRVDHGVFMEVQRAKASLRMYHIMRYKRERYKAFVLKMHDSRSIEDYKMQLQTLGHMEENEFTNWLFTKLETKKAYAEKNRKFKDDKSAWTKFKWQLLEAPFNLDKSFGVTGKLTSLFWRMELKTERRFRALPRFQRFERMPPHWRVLMQLATVPWDLTMVDQDLMVDDLIYLLLRTLHLTHTKAFSWIHTRQRRNPMETNEVEGFVQGSRQNLQQVFPILNEGFDDFYSKLLDDHLRYQRDQEPLKERKFDKSTLKYTQQKEQRAAVWYITFENIWAGPYDVAKTLSVDGLYVQANEDLFQKAKKRYEKELPKVQASMKLNWFEIGYKDLNSLGPLEKEGVAQLIDHWFKNLNILGKSQPSGVEWQKMFSLLELKDVLVRLYKIMFGEKYQPIKKLLEAFFENIQKGEQIRTAKSEFLAQLEKDHVCQKDVKVTDAFEKLGIDFDEWHACDDIVLKVKKPIEPVEGKRRRLD